MGTLLSLFTDASTGGTAIWVKVIAILVVIAGLIGVGAYGQAKIDADNVDKIKTEYAQQQVAIAVANQKQQDKYDADAAAAAKAAIDQQTQLTTEFSTHEQEITRYVPVTHACIPLGLLRVLNASASGLSLPAVPNTTGKSDDACSTVNWRDLARPIIAGFDACRSNAIQQNALIEFMRQAEKDHASQAQTTR